MKPRSQAPGDKMTSKALVIRQEAIKRFLSDGTTSQTIKDNLTVLNILCQIFADMEDSKDATIH